MDLILWRHAEAHELVEVPAQLAIASADASRKLTHRGKRQAARMAEWLDRQLPGSTRIVSSPALRCVQTAEALGRKFRLCSEIDTSGSAAELLALAQWPLGRQAVLVIGHQPALGNAIAQLLEIEGGDCPIRKGAVWWLRGREREGQIQTVVLAVLSPDLL